MDINPQPASSWTLQGGPDKLADYRCSSTGKPQTNVLVLPNISLSIRMQLKQRVYTTVGTTSVADDDNGFLINTLLGVACLSILRVLYVPKIHVCRTMAEYGIFLPRVAKNHINADVTLSNAWELD